jgi:serine protease Do
MPALVALLLVLGLLTPARADDRPQPPETFAPVVESLKATVFSVVRRVEDDRVEDDLIDDLFDPLGVLPRRTLGAAVVVDPAGIAITSARILRGLVEVDLQAVDGSRHQAVVLARDERTDIAVLRVRAPRPLRAARWGDSDAVRVGDWVLGIGSPYGFAATVSAGIVSGRPRVSHDGAFGDVLQTDAPINVASAGGPLVNVRGEIVGLAVAPGPRGPGIAFALPSKLVRRVVADLLAHGKVIRGWLGIATQPMTMELAQALRAPFAGGLLLADVVAGGPAAAAGLARGAILLAADGRPIRTLADLERFVDTIGPGRSATLDVWRDGREARVTVTLVPEPDPRQAGLWTWRGAGLVVDDITPEGGVFVARVFAGAAAAGLRAGDVVRELAQRTVHTSREFERIASGLPRGEPIMLLMQRGRTPFYVVLTPEP